MDPESEYCLRWKKYESNFRSFFSDLFESETLVDVSLVTQEGTITHAHRIVLAACSNYFQVMTYAQSQSFDMVFLSYLSLFNYSFLRYYIDLEHIQNSLLQ